MHLSPQQLTEYRPVNLKVRKHLVFQMFSALNVAAGVRFSARCLDRSANFQVLRASDEETKKDQLVKVVEHSQRGVR